MVERERQYLGLQSLLLVDPSQERLLILRVQTVQTQMVEREERMRPQGDGWMDAQMDG